MTVMAIYAPYFVVVAALLVFAIHRIQRRYHGAALDLGRLFNESNAPIFSHFEECLHGAITIRARCVRVCSRRVRDTLTHVTQSL
jgi:hypothetical protein